MRTEGLFRVPGALSDIKDYTEKMNHEKFTKFPDNESVHTGKIKINKNKK